MNIRNKPCPCGSGKKHKKCCGDAAMLSAKRQAEEEAFMRRMEENALKRQQELDEAKKRNPVAARRQMPLSVSLALTAALLGSVGGINRR